MRNPAVLVGFLALFPVAVFAQVSHVSASRSIVAAGGFFGEPLEVAEYQTSEFGVWNADAILANGLASARLRSTIESDHATLHADVTAANLDAVALCRLAWVFTIDRTMRWDLSYEFDVTASGSLFNTFGRTDDGDDDQFRSVRWFEGRDEPVSAFGYIEPGTYRLNLEAYAPTTQLSAIELVGFSLTVPAPSTAVFAMVSVVAMPRRRR